MIANTYADLRPCEGPPERAKKNLKPVYIEIEATMMRRTAACVVVRTIVESVGTESTSACASVLVGVVEWSWLNGTTPTTKSDWLCRSSESFGYT
jgi:hypothetical protein